ncbi:MAG TPA: hypothetical protein G4O07_02815 [Dehalococcoidia bacterium]|nr:hypothetical protein [Dehalococcoidia bacterium]
MKGKTKAVGILALVLVLTLGSMGVAYAHWNQTLYIEGEVRTGELLFEFQWFVVHLDHGLDWHCEDGMGFVVQGDKDVGSCTTLLVDVDDPPDGHYDLLEVTFSNVYPCYYEHLGFWLHNGGTIPLVIDRAVINGLDYSELPSHVELDLDGDGLNDIETRWGDNFGVQLDPGQSAGVSFDIHILQEAPQGETLTFTIEIVAVQWNEYSP